MVTPANTFESVGARCDEDRSLVRRIAHEARISDSSIDERTQVIEVVAHDAPGSTEGQ